MRLVLILVLQHQLQTVSGYVTGAFLNAELKEKCYLKLPEGILFPRVKHGTIAKKSIWTEKSWTGLERPSGQNNPELLPSTKKESNRTPQLFQNNKRMHIYHISSR